MSWTKTNLVTLNDGSDEYRCSECDFVKRYFTFRRDGDCPKCRIRKEGENIMGCWGFVRKCRCSHCRVLLVECPEENHPNSKYWYLQRDYRELLLVCPHGCTESGSFKYELWNKSKTMKKVSWASCKELKEII